MCGIVGLIYSDPKRKCSKETITKMRDSMIHRGPDEEGIYLSGNIGLGHRRLSIIDLSNGRQPMCNEDESMWIVYNGEIYNFKSLRDDLVKRGHIFKTNTDTEVILHLYEEKGTECVKDLNGMFAFAIFNERDQSIFVARDRIGIKPVYYAKTKHAFLFASEIKTFFKSGELKAEYNDATLLEYMLFHDIAGEETVFKNVKRLLPGHVLTLKNDTIHIEQYWSIFQHSNRSDIKFDNAVEELEYLLDDAVRIRMISDVPLGTFCSGGIDSSLVTAIASKYANNMLNTYSVGFHEKDFDETHYANIVSTKYSTKHHELKINNEEYASLLPDMIWHNDEPLNFSNSILIYAISKLSKEEVTVVLTGEGADELFAGYPRTQIPRILAYYQKMPKILTQLFADAAARLNGNRIQKLRNNLKFAPYDRLLFNACTVDQELISQLISSTKGPASFFYRRKVLDRIIHLNTDLVSIMCLSDQSTYLVSILNRQDKMSMAASIESRVPFLDHRIIEFSNSLPSGFKHKRFKGKRILKKVAKKFLPDEVINRKKCGFGVPIGQWMRQKHGLGMMVDDITNESGFPDWIDKGCLARFVAEHKSGARDHSELLWSVINLKIWNKLFLNQSYESKARLGSMA